MQKLADIVKQEMQLTIYRGYSNKSKQFNVKAADSTLNVRKT